MKKKILIAVCALLILALLLTVLQLLVVPKYRDNPEGALVREYYGEAGGHDVLFVGDCEIYESLIPAVMWEKYGISSYVRGSAQQLVWQSYYLLEEMLRYEQPKAVVFSVLALKYGTPQSEAFNRMTLDGMKWSGDKVSAIYASMTEEESFLEYVFPLLRFHSRVTQLTADDVRYAIKAPTVSQCGYLMQTGVVPRSEEDAALTGPRLSDYTLPTRAMDYLENMRVLCEEKGIELILIKAPTNSWGYWWYDQWEEQIQAYAAEKNITYYNMIPEAESMGIDWQTDTYDGGVHLNVYGAEKCSSYFGELLVRNHGISDRRGEEQTAARWNERVNAYYTQKRILEGK